MNFFEPDHGVSAIVASGDLGILSVWASCRFGDGVDLGMVSMAEKGYRKFSDPWRLVRDFNVGRTLNETAVMIPGRARTLTICPCSGFDELSMMVMRGIPPT
ncbi:MAG: hypothetical protein WCH40_14525, partial [Verrucomicrobiales bacterium]